MVRKKVFQNLELKEENNMMANISVGNVMWRK
jgi:hypothetical protein